MATSCYLLSYPRSGNHLTRAIIESLTSCPTSSIYQRDQDRLSISERCANRLGVDLTKSASVWKVHRMAHLEARLQNDWRLILLVRDPVESIWSNLETAGWLLRGLSGRGQLEWQAYLENLEAYGEWPTEKLLLYYEDLKSHPIPFLQKLGQFLGVSPQRIDEVSQDFPKIQEIALSSLQRPARSQDDVSYYRKKSWRSVPKFEVAHHLYPLLERYDSVVRETTSELT